MKAEEEEDCVGTFGAGGGTFFLHFISAGPPPVRRWNAKGAPLAIRRAGAAPLQPPLPPRRPASKEPEQES